MLSVLDECTREVLCMAVRPKMNAGDVLDVLRRLVTKHVRPNTFDQTMARSILLHSFRTG